MGDHVYKLGIAFAVIIFLSGLLVYLILLVKRTSK
jgi:hypothetical protein